MSRSDFNPGARDSPNEKHNSRFYSIAAQDDGTVDVYIAPVLKTYTTDTGTEYDVSFRVVRGVIPWDGLEDDIRTRYEAWCESGEVMEI